MPRGMQYRIKGGGDDTMCNMIKSGISYICQDCCSINMTIVLRTRTMAQNKKDDKGQMDF